MGNKVPNEYIAVDSHCQDRRWAGENRALSITVAPLPKLPRLLLRRRRRQRMGPMTLLVAGLSIASLRNYITLWAAADAIGVRYQRRS